MGLVLISGVCAAGGEPHEVPVSLSPPGGLSPAQTPQMVLVTFDDAVNTSAYARVQSMTAGRSNPNGTGLQFTFFVSTDWTDYSLVNKLYSAGHEIALHTMSHTTGTNTTNAEWRGEIVGARRALSHLGKVPQADIVGFRAPFLRYNNDLFEILDEHGFMYEASITELPGIGSLSQGADAMIWPYTLGDGVQQQTLNGQIEDAFPLLFEIPLWVLLDDEGNGVSVMDPVGTDEEILDLLKFNFTARYNGNRAPMGLFLHAWAWTSGVAVLNEFIDWAQTHSNVWFVSTQAAAQFMWDPQDVSAAHDFLPFIARDLAPWPEDDIRVTTFTKGSVRCCGERPIQYPAPDNVYWERVPLPGATGALEVANHWHPTWHAYFYLTNDTDEAAMEWSLAFTLPGGTLEWVSGGSGIQQGDDVTIWSAPNTPIPPQGVVTTYWGVTYHDTLPDVVIQPVFYHHQPMQPELHGMTWVPGSGWALAWTDSAYGYTVEECMSPLSDWLPILTMRRLPFAQVPVDPSVSSGLYRVVAVE